MRTLRAAVYGDVNLNILDGSAIWTQSMVEALSATGRCETTVLLKAPVLNDRLVRPMLGLPNVRVVRPFEEGLIEGPGDQLTPADATQLLRELDDEARFDVVVARGMSLVVALARSRQFDGRLWTYLTDMPQSLEETTRDRVDALEQVARASRLLLCQTEDLRTYLEAIVPEASGRCVLYPPVVPPVGDIVEGATTATNLTGRPVRLVYTGKYALLWNTFEMTQVPAALAGRGVTAEVHMIGDKVHRESDAPDFYDRMTDALKKTEGVVWHGGMPRRDAMALTATADVGLSWRDPRMDCSLELSTKVLEYGALGLPVLLNRTRVHEELLGADYPLFVNSFADVVDAVEALHRDALLRDLAVERCAKAASQFTLDEAVGRLRSYFDRVFPAGEGARRGEEKLKLGVASHDLKFFSRLLEYFDSLDDIELRVDEWAGLSQHDVAASRRMAEWADVVICEWCGPNAVWYSRNKREGQRLVVRLHRFELDAGYWKNVNANAVDTVVCVSPYYAQLTQQRTSWPASLIRTVPNWVDTIDLDRVKLPGAIHHLGIVGIAPSRKRMDRALDVLARLRRRDDRFQLFVKSKYPWDYWWIWNKADERAHYEETLSRIRRDPTLRSAVVFDPYGPDVAGWLRKIGWVLSTSDDESFHLAPAEGMASRALPMVLHWPGADTIYPSAWVRESADEMADRILEISSNGGLDAHGEEVRRFILENFPVERVCEQWLDVVAPK
ncbi:MAG: glycosyl transferase [Actinomycetia bacterium]|nr:glycosyl transferase [Actinomycetes bacterium]